MTPVVPHPAAMTSPQYLSLHQDMHHPPSASRFPGRPGAGAFVLVCWRRAAVTRDALAPSRVAFVWVGVARAMVCARETWPGDGPSAMLCISNSSLSVHVLSDGCSLHSYTRSRLSVDIVAFPISLDWLLGDDGGTYELQAKMMRREFDGAYSAFGVRQHGPFHPSRVEATRPVLSSIHLGISLRC